jgi:hypothetical protein
MRMKAAETCRKAADLVSGARHDQHGDLRGNHQNISALWSAFIGVEISPMDVALMMTLLKIARTQSGTHNGDDFVDGAAYMGIAGEIAGDDSAG